MICEPCCVRLIGVRGSDKRITSRPTPPSPRRKSMLRISRPPLAAAGAELSLEAAAGAGAAAISPAAPAPTVTMRSLPETLVVYGCIASRFSTMRVRPLASAASTVSTPAEATSMRCEGSASVTPGRSSEMRAGLSIVKLIGSGAGPDKCIVSCTCLPPIVCTSMDCSELPVASAAWAPCMTKVAARQASASPSALRRWWKAVDRFIRLLSIPVTRSGPGPRDVRCSRPGRRERVQSH